jgi:hypothetical protein
MAYNKKEWLAKMDKATTGEQIRALIMELPDGPPPERERETEEDGRELYLLEGRTPVRCYDERDVYFYVPFYEKVGNDCINGIQVTTMFLGMDHRCLEGQTHWFGKDGPLLFQTKIYAKVPGVEVKYVGMFCSTYEEAEQMHQIAVERVRGTPLEELAYIYSHIYTL